MVGMPVAVDERVHVMNILPLKTVGHIFRSVKE